MVSHRNFSRVEEFNINTWKFREVNPAITRSLEDELDLSNWEPVAETLGLTNSQIERCLRSDAFTHAVFTTMEECPHFQDLTVKRFLKTLLEHNRRDILSKLEKFVRLKPGSDAAKTFTVYPEGSAGAGGGILLGQCACNTQAHFSKRLTLCCRYCRLSFCVRFRTETSAERFRTETSAERVREKRYNCFAHSMMLDQHVEYGSKNGFCRAVCPARFPEERSPFLEI
ncbi:hypothetical protein O3P69_017360 [Scylla paramamosain]|uniref:Death domain-containing protein n=1 Tax=Scylla paramamosain TaxID=85552 RepID=A0AAW0SCR7_SCYPA